MWRRFSLLILLAMNAFAVTDKIVCYHGTWANYRPGNCRFTVENIDPFLCTHVVYGFVGVKADGSIRLIDSRFDIYFGGLTRFTGLKKENPDLKALVAIGGWNEGSRVFSAIASSDDLRAKFVKDAVTFLKTYGFDGVDLNWDYPAQRGGASTDKVNFSKLLAEFRAEFDKHDFLLTAAVAPCSASADKSYEIPELNRYLDFIIVLTYDMHGPWESVTGHTAPLYPSSAYTSQADKSLNIDSCIGHWINSGAAREKLILGVATYGRTFLLNDPSNFGMAAPASGGATAGLCTQENGVLGYNEICVKLQREECNIYWDNEQQVQYAVCGNEWIGYDSRRSIALKAQYARSQGLGGVMIWSVEADDFNGVCGPVNINLKTIKTTLELPETPTNPGGGSNVTTTNAPSSGVCTTAGYVRDPQDCSAFYQCVQYGDSFIEYKFTCPGGLYFDASITACNYAASVDCSGA